VDARGVEQATPVRAAHAAAADPAGELDETRQVGSRPAGVPGRRGGHGVDERRRVLLALGERGGEPVALPERHADASDVVERAGRAGHRGAEQQGAHGLRPVRVGGRPAAHEHLAGAGDRHAQPEPGTPSGVVAAAQMPGVQPVRALLLGDREHRVDLGGRQRGGGPHRRAREAQPVEQRAPVGVGQVGGAVPVEPQQVGDLEVDGDPPDRRLGGTVAGAAPGDQAGADGVLLAARDEGAVEHHAAGRRPAQQRLGELRVGGRHRVVGAREQPHAPPGLDVGDAAVPRPRDLDHPVPPGGRVAGDGARLHGRDEGGHATPSPPIRHGTHRSRT
jgi:hypothetical protein